MEKIREILIDIRPEFDFQGDDDFIKSGMLDSFDVILLVSELEKEFAVKIKAEDIIPENFSSIDQIVCLVEKNRK